MSRAFIGVGSNIDPEKNVKKALRLLAVQVFIVKISSVYRTEPEFRQEQPWYYNCVVEIATEIRPEELKFAVLRPIERKLGRERTADPYAARTIDLDLLLYGDRLSETAGLILPDPDIFKRPYLAAALLELSPDLDPRIAAAAKEANAQKMQPLANYTQLLEREILHASKR